MKTDNPYYEIDSSTVVNGPVALSKAVEHALHMFQRDMDKVFNKQKMKTDIKDEVSLIELHHDKQMCDEEAYIITVKEDGLRIIGSDDLGLIYGLLHISKTYLGIDPFWYWIDQRIKKRESVHIPLGEIRSPKRKVRFRGWFVNDEVCLIGWKEPYPPTKEVWHPVFEALLRSGGNMVIPGTDLPKEGIHFELASEMGLWITHHHAEPLGAEMFKRVYPDEQASYATNHLLYEQLWEEAIEKQKEKKVVWVLSFRGQGDTPFWTQDPTFDTPSKRGEMISRVIKKQLEMIQEHVDSPQCCVALYGEISELYRGGYIDLPQGVIKVWADNGYGKMVSRRNGNEDFRISSMPEGKEYGEQGIYYHVTFHDLQASNHLTMFPNEPTLIVQELEEVFATGGDDYLLVNSGNIRMHLYPLDIVSDMWNVGNVEVNEHLQRFVQRLYSSHHHEIAQLYKSYFQCSVPFGEHVDNRAGEQFYHHPARRIIGHWMQGKATQSIEALYWATGERSFDEQVCWFKERCQIGYRNWTVLNETSQVIFNELSHEDRTRFFDQFHIQVILHCSGNAGFIKLCEAYEFARKDEFPKAFVSASQAIWYYEEGVQALRQSEHGKWANFYKADWLTNVQWTIESLQSLRRYLRMHGDSPHFFNWYKEFMMPDSEKHIYLENTHRNPLSDDDLAKGLQEVFSM
ncbi:glycosyl hydrolase 115 family protein [Alkalihalobacillus hemicellulosilyticus]|uniref:Uncharacterized protein n=1 Tax=Halalkalibacter hemicellulosilyticusJCM 9152 TaxID=1236971 RepID=W4QGZ7_9BACI|nr:glycosyl hydrolase 115 family protein [Halalkalibacter hemicellulosilyticus]GAE31197.1 hypothetical protein JCM9152_2649 [Halalkalibacter hemicellulosilyticusJCM 9152]